MEENSRSTALIKRPSRLGRSLSECIALAKAKEQKFAQPPILDPEFEADVREAVAAHDEPIGPTR